MNPSPEAMADLRNRFNYHKPPNEKIVQAHEVMRAACFATAMRSVETVPEGREQALALTKLEEAMMWANAGIARNPKGVE